MSLRIVLNPKARVDFDEAKDWYYEQQGEGLKVRFIEAVDSAFMRIRSSPSSFPVVYGTNVRRVQVRKFPFTIFFTVQTDRILVYSVFHTSRSPLTWQKRID